MQNVYTTPPTFDDAGSPSALVIAGPAGGASTSGLCGEDGDTDTGVTIGTNGNNGVLAALAVRQFTHPNVFGLTLGGTPGGGATELDVQAYGLYY